MLLERRVYLYPFKQGLQLGIQTIQSNIQYKERLFEQFEMQSERKKSEQEQLIVDSLKLLFYPQYQPNASASQFLSYHEPLFWQLRKLDQATQQQMKKLQIFSRHSGPVKTQRIDEIQKIIYFIIQELNNLCTYCHRNQLRVRISEQLSKYKNNLKNIPIGKRPIKISNWEDIFYSKTKIQSIEQTKRRQVLTILDKIYIQHKRIPHYYLILLQFPQILINLYNFQEKIIFDSQCEKTSMPLVHKYYIGVIAAATYGNRYFWNFMVEKFIKYGGDAKWVQNGLEQIPQYLKKFSQISYQMAYHFKINILQDLCADIGKIIEDSSILEGFYILSYFQFLSCVTLVFGLVSQSIQYEKYLPSVPYIRPSLQSFQTMKEVSKKEFKYENEIARQFQEMYCWQKDSEKENMKRVELQILQKKSCQSKKFIKSVSTNFLQNTYSNSSLQQTMQLQNQLMVTLEEEEIIRKIKASNTMQNIQNIYGKYVEFDKRRSLIEFKRKEERKVKTTNFKEQNSESNEQNSSEEEYDFIYASVVIYLDLAGMELRRQCRQPHGVHNQPHFPHNCVRVAEKPQIRVEIKEQEPEDVLRIPPKLHVLVHILHQPRTFLSLHLQINQGLQLVQKNYVKLLTRSPFLFNQKSFLKMKQDLQSKCKIFHPFRFALEIFSFKLEHSLSLGSYAYYRYIQNK